MEWIDVNDKLPESTDDVLIFCGNNQDVGVGWYSPTFLWNASLRLVETMNNMDAIQNARNLNITYWMPLPQLP